jgi:hypothetical protein
MSRREAGKGSKPRPFSVDEEEFSNNWDNIFKKPKTEYQLNKSTGEVESVTVLESVIDEKNSVDE